MIARKQAIENTRSICQHFKRSLEVIEELVLNAQMDCKEKLELQNLMNELKASIEVKSEYMLLKELEKTDFYIRSNFVEFARKQQEYRNPDNLVKLRDVTYGVATFPLQAAFHKLFNKTNLFVEILAYINKLKNSNTIDNYVQCKYTLRWKRFGLHNYYIFLLKVTIGNTF